MIQNRELTMDDYLAMLRRRVTVILIPTLLAPLVGFLVSYAFTPKFTSQSLVLVEEQKVPEGYVAPVVTEDLTQRVATLEQKALGADRLRPLIDKLNQQGILHGGNVDELIDEIRNNVQIQAVQTVVVPTPGATGAVRRKGESQVPGFYVNYTSSNPREAQGVGAGLVDIMLQENLRDREQVAQNTTDFLSRQVEDAKHNLDDLDSRLATFKKQYIGQLPGDEENNLKILMGMNSQLDATTQLLNRAQQDKSYTESLLAEQLTAWKTSQSETNPETIQKQLEAEQALLVSLHGQYTDDHPDVMKTKREIADLQKRLDNLNSATANASPTAGTTTGPTASTTTGPTAGTTAKPTAGTTAGTTTGSTAKPTAGTTAGTTTGSTAKPTAGTTAGTTTGSTAKPTAGTTAGTTTGSTAKPTAGTTAGTTTGSTAKPTAGTTASTTISPTTNPKPSPGEPPEIQQLRMQVHQYQEGINQANRQQKMLEDQIKIYQGRVALSPAVEEQYKELTRDYDTAQKFYDDLLAKRSQSEMQTAMERDQQGEQMRLQIPADLPDSPSFPNRPLFAAGGLGGGLLIGLGLALWLEMRDTSVRTESDVLLLLELPVLSQVPWVGLKTGNTNGRNNKPELRSPSTGDSQHVEVKDDV